MLLFSIDRSIYKRKPLTNFHFLFKYLTENKIADIDVEILEFIQKLREYGIGPIKAWEYLVYSTKN